MVNLSVEMNEAQKQAIAHRDGPCMVLAGPGSGKTFVITNRTKYLMEQYGVNPSNILVITFTKAAAIQMKQRFQKLMDKSSMAVSFGTFHAIFFHILKYAYHYNADNIIREEDKHFFFQEYIRRTELEIEDESDFLEGITSEISKVKNERIPVEHYYSTNCPEEIFRKIFKDYEQYLRKKNQIDFDDMLVLCYELLKQREDILKAWQKKYRYILIDEFQDINRIQYEIIKMLALPENNLFIVGDDDQSIYRFRGADPRIMLNFEKDYPDTKKVILNMNYRSTGAVIQSAIKVIQNNTDRFIKKMQAYGNMGEPLVIREYHTFTEEINAIIDTIQEYRKKGFEYKQIAVLYRTNTQPRLLVQKLMEYNIPFKMKDSMPNIYEHWIVRNLLSYIKIALGNNQRSEYFQIMNKPKRYLSRDAFLEAEVDLDKIKEIYQDRDWMLQRIEQLEYDLQMLKDMQPFAAIQYIRKGIGYDGYLSEYAQYRRLKAEELYELLDEVQETSREYADYEQWFQHIDTYGKELKEQAKNRNQALEAVTLSTMHAAKGLEYNIVFIMDANEGIIPHHKSLLDEDIAEERRMFYVAMTRAREHLHIYSSCKRYNKDLKPSRFVGEIMLDREELKAGTMIHHKTYGDCCILDIEQKKMRIKSIHNNKSYVLDVNFCITNGLIQIQ